MEHLECPIRRTAVTHFVSADAREGETTGPVKHEHSNRSYSQSTLNSQEAAIDREPKFWLLFRATESLELPQTVTRNTKGRLVARRHFI